MRRRVVVTGLGTVTSLSTKVDDLFERLCRGESGIHAFTLMDTTGYKVTFGGDVRDWDAGDVLDHREMKRVDRFSQFALYSAVDAINQSGLDFSQEDLWNCGVIVGSGIGGLLEIEQQTEVLRTKGPNRVSAMTIPKIMLNAAGGNIAIRYGLRGSNYTVATACASATNAMINAHQAIALGELDIMITGGTEGSITGMAVSAFANMRALSTRNEAPEKASRPFDLDRDGFVLSEGAGILVFEELEHAKARGANILAEVFGGGASCDGGHITQPDEEGRGAARAMTLALKSAGLEPSQIDYINAHGTSTPLGDKAETLAIKNVFGDHARKLSISSTKSQLGHSLGASGGIEAVVTTKAIVEQTAPPTINLDTPDPACDLDYTPHEPRQREIRHAMSNSFGFGGHNASIVLGQYRE